MKTKIIQVAALATLILPCGADAISLVGGKCTEKSKCDGSEALFSPTGIANCASVSTKCYSYEAGSGINLGSIWRGYKTCLRCNSGYVLKSESVQIGDCVLRYNAFGCEEECKGCSNCTSDTTWSSGNTGYQKKATRTCNCNTCNTTWSYRCAAGYYGSSSNGTSGCTRCPSSGGVYGTSAAGSTAITSCYLPSGTSGTDSTGAWTYTQNCYYSN